MPHRGIDEAVIQSSFFKLLVLPMTGKEYDEAVVEKTRKDMQNVGYLCHHFSIATAIVRCYLHKKCTLNWILEM